MWIWRTDANTTVGTSLLDVVSCTAWTKEIYCHRVVGFHMNQPAEAIDNTFGIVWKAVHGKLLNNTKLTIYGCLWHYKKYVCDFVWPTQAVKNLNANC